MYNVFRFLHMENKEFQEKWNLYKDITVDVMDEKCVAKLGNEKVEIYIALEKEDGNEYINIFTTVCEDGEWLTADFFEDEDDRNNKIKSVLSEGNWTELLTIMYGLLINYCKDKKINFEHARVAANTLDAQVKDAVSKCEGLNKDNHSSKEKGLKQYEI